MLRIVNLLALVGLIALPVSAQGQTLVENVNLGAPFGEPDGSPFAYQAFGQEVLFSAFTDSAGREAWLTDGTEAGTRLFADLYPGPQ